jgi:hypothetical protein
MIQRGKKDKDGNVEKLVLMFQILLTIPSPAWIKKPVDLKVRRLQIFLQ